jgi:hypothetical protein
VLGVIRDQQVFGEIDLHAMALANGDGGEQVQEPAQNVRGRLREAGSHALAVGICRGLRQSQTAGVATDLGQTTDCSHCDGYTEDLQVMMVDLIFQSGLADLVQAMKLIQIDRVSVRHDEPMEGNGQAGLAKALNPLRFTQSFVPTGMSKR